MPDAGFNIIVGRSRTRAGSFCHSEGGRRSPSGLHAASRRSESMLYLMSREVGRDANCIGFPSVKSCLAVVVQTTQELIGWHVFNTPRNQTITDAGAFAQYVTANANGHAVRLYGATTRAERGNNPGWKQELLDIAQALHYHGPATAFDMNVAGEGSYVEFVRDANARKCDIYFKRNSKMTYTTTDTDIHAMVQRYVNAGNLTFLYGGDDDIAPIYTNAQVNTATSKKGRLNSASWFHTNDFTVP
jgi:hypothetical protein